MVSPRRTLALLAVFVPLACGPSAPEPALPVPVAPPPASAAPAAAVEPPDGPLPKLRTGALERVDDTQVTEGRVIARSVDDTYETLAVELVLSSLPPGWR